MRIVPALALALFAAACVPQSEPPPSPAPSPQPTPVPVPTPSPTTQRSGDWRDWSVTPGDWVYRQDARGSIALFGEPGAGADFTIRCDRQRGTIYLSRKGSAPSGGAMTIRTSSTVRNLDATPTGGTPAYMAVALRPGDGLPDAMGFSRGRFTVAVAGLPTLVVPAWAEVLRVAEDCRA